MRSHSEPTKSAFGWPSAREVEPSIRQRDAAERSMRGELRVDWRCACFELFLGLEREMNIDLAIDVLILRVPPAPETKSAHGIPSQTGCMTRAMARASCRHFECSRARRFLPAAVSL